MGNFNQLKDQVLTRIRQYRNNKFLNIFSNHHHNERAISTLNFIENSVNIDTLKYIILNEKCLFENGDGLSKNINTDNRYPSSRYSREIRNRNPNNSSYFRAICDCENFIDRFLNLNISNSRENSRESLILINDYDNEQDFLEEAEAVNLRNSIDASFILDDNFILLEPGYYIYLIYENKYLSDGLQIRVVKAITEESFRHHSTLAHFNSFDYEYYKRFGIKKDVRVLMGGEILVGDNQFDLKIYNKSGHFRPSRHLFEKYKEFISGKFDDMYMIEFIDRY